MAKRLSKFINMKEILPPTQFGFKKGLGTADALLTLVHDLQLSLDSSLEARVLSLIFSSAFDLVNHDALLYMLKVSGSGPIFNVLVFYPNDVNVG